MSTVIVNTLTGTTTAGSISVTGEGNSTTTNLQQGLTKVWITIPSGQGSITDSLNVSSLDDDATGNCGANFTNNMGNATYCIQSHDHSYGNGWSDSETTGGYDTKRRNESQAYLDVSNIWSNVLGDLA